MTIYEKMNAIIKYYNETIKPYIDEQIVKAPTLTKQDKDNITTDINNLENSYKELLQLCKFNVVDIFNDDILSLLIDNIDKITKRYSME